MYSRKLFAAVLISDLFELLKYILVCPDFLMPWALQGVIAGVNICPKKSETVYLQIWVFWNCLSWSTRKSSKLSIKTFLKRSIKFFWNLSQYLLNNVEECHQLALRFQFEGDSVVCAGKNLKCRRTSAHIFHICLVQNCLSQVYISETVYRFWNCLSWQGQANGFSH